ncbi:hypothetical protein [Sphingomonas montana]|uniref:hypothetical protein n=1 Tax=Sphingomonas montana TaxID=1843236 RepID=UPI001F0AAB8D
MDVVRETARARFASAKVAIAVLIAAIFVVQAGLTVLFLAIGSGLAHWLGVGGGQAVAAVIAFAIAGIMVKYALSHFSPAETTTGDRS